MSQRLYADTGADVDVDIIAVATDEGLSCVNLMMVRGGRQLGDRSFFPQNAEERDAKEVLAAFIGQHYLERPVPAVVVVGEELDSGELEATLTEHAKRSVRILTRPTAERRAWLEMALQNALHALKARLSEQGTQGMRLAALREGLGLPDTVQRIECFDVSHTMGEAAVAACVVYDPMDMRRGEYRRVGYSRQYQPQHAPLRLVALRLDASQQFLALSHRALGVSQLAPQICERAVCFGKHSMVRIVPGRLRKSCAFPASKRKFAHLLITLG